MASLERLSWSDAGTRFKVIGVSTDDYRDRALDLLNRTNATISHYIDEKLVLENMLGASQIPLTVLVDADGRVVEKVLGIRKWDGVEARQLIEKAFSARKPPARAGAR